MVVQIKPPPIYDTSHWKIIPNFADVDPRPRLVITKATEGTKYVDQTFIKYFQDLLQDGIRRGCFHFFRKAENALEQAKHFCNTIRPYITTKDILVLDVEEGGETAGQLWTWCEYVRSQFPSNLLLIYSRKNILEAIPTLLGTSIDVRGVIKMAVPYLPGLVLKALDYLFAKVENRRSVLNAIPMTMAERAYFKRIPTWPAGYPFNPDLYSTIPSFYIPDQTRWGEPWLWQYSDQGSVRGISNEVDLNLGMPQLIAWLGSESMPDPEPPTGELPMPTHYFEVRPTIASEYRTIRNDHIRTAAEVGRIAIGTMAKARVDNVYVFPADVYSGATLIAKKDDRWVNIFENNGSPINGGWVAEIHLGQRFTNLVEVGAPSPAPDEDRPKKVTLEMESGRVFVADQFTQQI